MCVKSGLRNSSLKSKKLDTMLTCVQALDVSNTPDTSFAPNAPWSKPQASNSQLIFNHSYLHFILYDITTTINGYSKPYRLQPLPILQHLPLSLKSLYWPYYPKVISSTYRIYKEAEIKFAFQDQPSYKACDRITQLKTSLLPLVLYCSLAILCQ